MARRTLHDWILSRGRRTLRDARQTPTAQSPSRALRFEPLEHRRMLAASEFHFLALIYPEVSIAAVPAQQRPAVSATMTPEAIANAIEGVQVQLPTLVNQLTNGQVNVRVHVQLVDRPLDELFWSGSNYDFASEAMVDEELDQFTQSGWYDHVITIHGLYGVPYASGAYWGGGGLARYGMSMATINVDPSTGSSNHAGFVPGMLHEWTHGLEVQYFDVRGVPKGLDPEGNPTHLHSAENFGYTGSTDGRPEWAAWYGDFLTDDIRNLHTDGADTDLGLGPDAWALGPPRDDVPFTPGSPLSWLELSGPSPLLLSDAYWVSATTDWGEVRRNVTVENNPIRINGVNYATGIGTHAHSEIVVNLFGKADRFQAFVGVDDDVPSNEGSVAFKVYGDGQLLFDSGLMTGADAARSVDVDMIGVQQLRLVVDDGGVNGAFYDHAVWGDARLTPFLGLSLSNIDWKSSSTGYGSILLDRTIEHRRFA